MKKITFILVCLFHMQVFAQQSFGDITLSEKQTIQENTLSLNGGGIREKLIFDLYVGGLYLTTKTSDANAIINADEPMSIHLEITSKLISSKNMSEAVIEGFEKSTNGNTEQFAEQIPAFINAFKEEIVKGNTFDISYIPEMGVVVSKNDKFMTSIRGLEFKKALFGIWLGEKPADKKLKKGMLGL